MRALIRLLLPFALLAPLCAQETILREVYDPVTDTHVEVTALFSNPSPTGYLPVRVKIANNLKRDRSVRLDFEANGDYTAEIRSRSGFDFDTPAGKTVTRDIMVPLGPISTAYCKIEMSGDLGQTTQSLGAQWSDTGPVSLLSESLYTLNASALDTASSHSSSRGTQNFAAKFDPKQSPDDWRAYSGYDSILMTDDDWTNLPAGARNAIISWLNLGGQLVVYRFEGSPENLTGLPTDAGYGSIKRPSLGRDLRLDANATVALVNRTSQQESIREDFRTTWPLQDDFGQKQFHYELFVLVMIIFAILVGPINLFVFAKSGRRHRLFITTPLISLGASLLMILLIIFQDGFGGSGVRRVLMEVRPDAGMNSAFVHQEQFSRTGVLSNVTFTVDTPMLMRPVPIKQSRWARYTGYYGMKGSYHAQPADNKTTYSGDWWQSRSEQGQIVDAVVSTRGRIERADAGQFVSTFEYPLELLLYLDEHGQWHRAENIATGKKFALTPIDPTMAATTLKPHIQDFTKRYNQLLAEHQNRRGHFVAFTTKAPGIETNSTIKWKETQTVITGPVL